MEITSDNLDFWIMYILDKYSDQKLALKHEQTLLMINKLNMKNYSHFIEKLTVVLVALSPNARAEQERLVFRRKNKEIEIYINLDYQKLLQASENQVLEMIAETYLQAIKRFLSKRKDFDHQRFYSDLENLFIQHGYLFNKT